MNSTLSPEPSTSVDTLSCDDAYTLTLNPVFRINVIVKCVVSWVSIPILVYFIFGKLVASPFHGNIKVLLIVYFLNALFCSIIGVYTFTFHWVYSLLPMADVCELFLSRTHYMALHLPNCISVIIFPCVMTSIVVERIIAVSDFVAYERRRVFIGPLLAVVSVIISVAQLCWAYRDETFLEPQVSFLITPSTSAAQINLLFAMSILMSVACLLANCVLLVVNIKLEERRRRRSSLSARYQMSENVLTTRFAVCVSVVHVLFFMVYLVGSLGTRMFRAKFATYVDFLATRNTFYVVPLFNLAVVLASLWLLRVTRRTRTSKIASVVSMKFTGIEGANNYFDAMAQQWQSQH